MLRFNQQIILPEFEVFVDEHLYFFVRVFGWMLPDNYEMYSMYSRSFMDVTFSNVILSLGQLHLSNGIYKHLKHVISKTFDYFKYCESKSTLHQDAFYRSNSCDMLVPASQPSTTCKNCQKQNVIVNSEINHKQANLQILAKLNALIKFTSPERVKLTIISN